jgi:prevent-host-death family protein
MFEQKSDIAAVTSRRFSVADARQPFAALIALAEDGAVVEITGHGKADAVIVSAARYASVTGASRGFAQALRDVRDRFDVDTLEIDDDVFDGLRDRSPGRSVST